MNSKENWWTWKKFVYFIPIGLNSRMKVVVQTGPKRTSSMRWYKWRALQRWYRTRSQLDDTHLGRRALHTKGCIQTTVELFMLFRGPQKYLQYITKKRWAFWVILREKAQLLTGGGSSKGHGFPRQPEWDSLSVEFRNLVNLVKSCANLLFY